MTIERFTRFEFERVLDKIFGRDSWETAATYGEIKYAGWIGGGKKVQVMSSINPITEIADDTGENSIRVWVTDNKKQPLMPKINHWTTRLPGWQERLESQVQLLKNTAEKLEWCKVCNDFEHLWKVKKHNENRGKLFARCQCENSFRWFD